MEELVEKANRTLLEAAMIAERGTLTSRDALGAR
jgi:hypothetical protein